LSGIKLQELEEEKQFLVLEEEEKFDKNIEVNPIKMWKKLKK
jgi:hypothetical protein